MSNTLRLLLGRKWLLVLIWLSNLVAGYLVVSPVAAAIDASALCRLPHAQTSLFGDGGLVLIEWLRLDGLELVGSLKAALLLGAAASLLQLFPTGLLIAGLGDREKLSLARHGQRALVATPPLVLVFGSALLAQTILFVLLALCYGTAASHIATPWQPWLALVLSVLALSVCWLPRWFEDLTRVFIVHRQLSSLPAVREAWRCFVAQRQRLFALAVAVSVGAVAIACFGLLSAWRLGNLPSGARGPLQFVSQQAVMLALVTLRAFYVGRLIDLVNSWPPAPDGTHASISAPGDPNQGHAA